MKENATYHAYYSVIIVLLCFVLFYGRNWYEEITKFSYQHQVYSIVRGDTVYCCTVDGAIKRPLECFQVASGDTIYSFSDGMMIVSYRK